LWYSDLRHSTELADRLSAEAFLHLLGRYFEMTASSVLDHGGEVVSLIGDAVLGLFRFEGAPNEACGRALAAAQEARRRLSTPQSAAADVAFDFGISLHLGQVIYGNVGVPERLQFTLVGSAVNEVVRVQDLTKKLGYPLLATAPFAGATTGPWHPLGEHILRGLETPMPILTTMQP
jgi:adenylate cyclase